MYIKLLNTVLIICLVLLSVNLSCQTDEPQQPASTPTPTPTAPPIILTAIEEEDIDGMRIAVRGGTEDAETIDALGGVDILIPRDERYLALEKGLIHGFIDDNGLLITETPQEVPAVSLIPTTASTPITPTAASTTTTEIIPQSEKVK